MFTSLCLDVVQVNNCVGKGARSGGIRTQTERGNLTKTRTSCPSNNGHIDETQNTI